MTGRDELEQARAEHAATSEILRIIAASPTDADRVLDAIARSAAQLCAAEDCEIRLLDGNIHRPAAHFGPIEPGKARPFTGKGPLGSATRERRTIHADVREHYPESRMARLGVRSALVVPLLHEQSAIGAIILRRFVVAPFSDRQIQLLETFAAQAAIAIQNVRLFNETKEALEQQTATAEILRVISSSPTDLQPVFESILTNALRFCSAHMGQLYLYDGEKFHNVANRGATPAYIEYVTERGPFRPLSGALWERVVLERRPVEVADLRESCQYRNRFSGVVALVELNGARAHVAVPMLKDGSLVGIITIYRPEAQPFLQKQIELLATFAAQAVIAIENVRLFNETKAALEQLADANRAKSRFLAAASHDLRQPVHALGLFVAQFQEARDPGSRERIIGKVEASTAAVSQLVEALLDISKLDQGTIAPQIRDFPLQPLLDRLEQAFSVSTQQKELRFRMRRTPLFVRSDPVLLERVVLNFMANAVRYTREGGIIVAARRRGALARIEVWDTGIGIPPEEQRHIFEEFYQAAGAPDGAAKGLGLGLAIVDRLARLLGLTVSLRSVPGAGSVFAVEVPLGVERAVRIAPAAQPPEIAHIEGLRVLLVDDDAAAREAAAGLLTQWGCEVVSAASGAEAHRLLAAGSPPSVIISDYRLGPHERGTDVVKEIRRRLETNVPAVIVSADSIAASVDAVAAEGLHLLRKPLRAAQLRVLLHHLIVGASSSESASPP
jgi:signal transduction histidine kinase/ActR/RegA family two-component response regulator